MTRSILWYGWCEWIKHWCLIAFTFFIGRRACQAHGRRRSDTAIPAEVTRYARAKPPWVQREILWLAARDSHAGCRRLADIFNRRHAASGMTVGKSFVANVLRRHTSEVMRLRRDLRKRRYTMGRPNVVWGVDGTGKTDEAKNLHFLLGIVDHGTRRCLTLRALKDKASITVLRALLDTIECYGTPKAIRTDNEAIFQSRLFRAGLRWLGIRHQTTDRHCPWQNGRIERFFGTLKAKLDCWAVADAATLNASLNVFGFWYNHVRPHQHLQGHTPVEAWRGIDVYRRRAKRRLWFDAWEGLLQGEYLQH